MIAVAISVGSFAYWYSVSYVKATSKTAFSAVDATATTSDTGSFLNAIIRNTGSLPININEVVVYHDAGHGSVKINKQLNPGDSISVVVDEGKVPGLSFTPGHSYTIVVTTSQGNFTSTAYCMGG